MSGQRRALVLGGGGNLGAVQVGFIRRIKELEIPIDFVVGTSVGALNAAHYAFHETDEHDCLAAIWTGLRGQRLFPRSPWRVAANLVRHRMSLFDDSFVSELIREHLDQDDFSAARVPLYMTATNLRRGDRTLLSSGSIVTAALASSAFPGLFPPVLIDGELHVDGAVVDSLDLAAAIELGASEVIAIDPSPGLGRSDPTHVGEVFLRSIEILTERRAQCAIAEAQELLRVAVIRPGMTAEDQSGFEQVDEMIEQSYSMAVAVFEQCWDGETVIPGTYQLAVPTGV